MAAAPHSVPDASPPPDRLWRFAVEVYRCDGVAEACLSLQDEHGQDVTLLLCAAWAGAEAGRALSPRDACALMAATAPWRDEVVVPLRTLRRRLKAGPSPAPNAASAALRDKVKHVELEAERIALAALERAVTDWPETVCCAQAVQQNLAAGFAAAAGHAATGEAADNLGRIAAAALEAAR